MKPELSLILPVHNEAEIIEQVFKKIQQDLDSLHISYECLLVENGSTDTSWNVLKKLKRNFPKTIILTAAQGYGCAVLMGIKKSKGRYICYMPSDGQIDSKWIKVLLQEIKKNNWDLVKIKRKGRETYGRSVTSYILRILTGILFKSTITDINGSPRIFHRSTIQLLALKSKDSFIDVEFAAKIALLSWKIKEIPVPNLPRVGGISTRNYLTYIEFIKNMWNYKRGKILKSWHKKITSS